ncbi:MAG: hypothetical protein IKS92_00830 [Victivallales bacterium]|nr:hypothetical protein [Victivallales bacterium]MBR4369562.1 hypothetical protein [Victivallales bacterium]
MRLACRQVVSRASRLREVCPIGVPAVGKKLRRLACRVVALKSDHSSPKSSSSP